MRILPFLLASLFLIGPSNVGAQSLTTGLDWTHPAYDVGNTGFSPQTVINRENVAGLELRWVYQVPGSTIRQSEPEDFETLHVPTGLQTRPLVINGIVYIATDYNRVIALMANDGEVLWRFSAPAAEFDEKDWWAHILAQHSIDYDDGMILMQASDCSLYGLDSLSGEVRVEISDTCKNIAGNTGLYFGSFSPIRLGNVLITRPSGGLGERGFIAGYDVQSGEMMWRWYTVPPSQVDIAWEAEYAKGNVEAYEGDWGERDLIGGGGIWSLIALDESDHTIYFPVAGPSPQYDASLRPGPNLYASSIIAVDAFTGEMKWYYQINPHDINQHEARWSVILTTIMFKGRETKAVIAAAKSNFIYVLNAETGQPVYEPIHVGSRNVGTPNDNAGNDADLAASQSSLVGALSCPSFVGGVDSAPALVDQTLFVVSQNFCSEFFELVSVYKGREIRAFEHRGGETAPTSTLYAVDLSIGQVKWEKEIPNRQQYSAVTASGGVIYVVDRTGEVFALDEDNGEVLNRIRLGGLGGAGVSIGATAQGEMMMFVATGGSGDFGDETSGFVAAFGIPRSTREISNLWVPVTASVGVVFFLLGLLIGRKKLR